MNDKNNVHVEGSFQDNYSLLSLLRDSKESLDPEDEDVQREKEKVLNMVSMEDSTFSAIIKVRKRTFPLGTLCLYCHSDLFKRFMGFKLDHYSETDGWSFPAYHKAT